ncbi:hypothetical protein [Daejeonella oryzae]|uniref:hypothetical protein n=1 Tax=Daejeonella oryzae TaxID=1122943 RepID=UPI00047E6259|nr:hypothetical protein [Daejeonella oryzae]
MLRKHVLLIIFIPLLSYGQNSKQKSGITPFNQIAENYVRLGLAIGQYDSDFVDAYYGPDSLKPVGVKEAIFPKDRLLNTTNILLEQLRPYIKDKSLGKRAIWIRGQLTAFSRRIKMFAGEPASFELQAKELFGVELPNLGEDHFRILLNQMDQLLPGRGDVNARFQTLANRFVIPREKLDTVIKTCIAESAKRTRKQVELPHSEEFRLEYVNGKPWSGYNWYQGNYKSLIQFNSDITALIDRVIDIASHEGYPGHHVYNTLFEKNLYHNKGWIEISLYPLFSPQSLIAEGSGNYGLEVAFPGEEKINFTKSVVLPLAGLDTTGIGAYYQALAIKGKLQHVRTEVTRRVINGTMNDDEAIRWLMNYGLFNKEDAVRSLSFSRKYQSYVINYTYGYDLVKNYIERNGGTSNNPSKRWELFKWLLSNEVTPADMQ